MVTTYPLASTLTLPVANYGTGDLYKFGSRIRRHTILWATHLGDDVAVAAGTVVTAIGNGQVVWSQMRLGSLKHRDWGGVVVIGHTRPDTEEVFFSVYGHVTAIEVKVGDVIRQGQSVGTVAPAATPENGWWQHAHLHFSIYSGPWRDLVPPGWYRPEYLVLRGFSRQTKRSWWHDPQTFIADFAAPPHLQPKPE